MKCPQCGSLCNYTVNDVCINCHEENKGYYAQINKLTKEGHTEHCAKRMTWGDGECECHKRKES